MSSHPVRTLILDLEPSTSVEEAEHLASELHMDLSWSLKRLTDYVAVRLNGQDYPIKNVHGHTGRWLPMLESA